jgi:hypothetical protein
MRRPTTITTTAFIIAVAAIFGITIINANSSRHVATAPASSAIDVMQMMKNAKDLPTQQFDAH